MKDEKEKSNLNKNHINIKDEISFQHSVDIDSEKKESNLYKERLITTEASEKLYKKIRDISSNMNPLKEGGRIDEARKAFIASNNSMEFIEGITAPIVEANIKKEEREIEALKETKKGNCLSIMAIIISIAALLISIFK